MSKEDEIIELIGEVAVQSTQHVLDSEQRLETRIDSVEQKLTTQIDVVEQRLDFKINKLDAKIDRVESSLRSEMQEMRNENATFHDEIIGYLKRAEQERLFMSEHLRRHDVQIAELQRAR